jgi:hypothetical protein
MFVTNERVLRGNFVLSKIKKNILFMRHIHRLPVLPSLKIIIYKIKHQTPPLRLNLT